MKIVKYFSSIVLVSIFISGCAGTGTKDVTVYSAQIEDSETTAFVIGRRTGYTGSAGLISIKIDGAEVGSLGEQEVGVYEVSEGAHTVEVKFKGIAGIGVNAGVKSRQIEDGEKVFYSIQQTMTLLSSKLKMLELTKEGFYDE